MKTQFDVMMEDAEFRRLFAIEALVAEASGTIARLMAEQNVTKAELARRLGKSRAWVTQLLSGKANVTVRTLAEVAFVLDSEIKFLPQAPSWKIGGKPAAPATTVVYRMDDFRIDPRCASADLFCVHPAPVQEVRPEDRQGDGRLMPHSEYAA